MRPTSICAAILLLIAGSVAWADSSRTYPKPPKHGGVYVVAHRGAHQGIPENTLADQIIQKPISMIHLNTALAGYFRQPS